jgi:metallo-beta-lactamase class B
MRMTRISWLVVAAILSFPISASKRAHDQAAEACIAENSGAESIDCLTAIADATKADILALENDVRTHADKRLQSGDILQTHHALAVSGLSSASKTFTGHAEHQCDAELGMSGAAASGSGQIYWSCTIRLNDDRIAYLRQLLARWQDTEQHLALTGAPQPTPALPAPSTPSPSATVDPSRCGPDYDWNQRVAPQKIYGNSWYVGTCGISAILVTSDRGHVLIDTGTEKGAEAVIANIRTLGFKPEDVRKILTSHEHFDHVGGVAALQRLTGATVHAREPAAITLERGTNDRSDPQFLSIRGFPAVTKVRRIRGGDSVRLGPLKLTSHATPGHTPGSTSWTWTSCEKGRCAKIAYVDSLTAISDEQYRYTDDAQHPGMLAAFRKTMRTVAELPCDILISTHPQKSDLWNRLGATATAPLLDSNACRTFTKDADRALDERVAKEREPPAAHVDDHAY